MSGTYEFFFTSAYDGLPKLTLHILQLYAYIDTWINHIMFAVASYHKTLNQHEYLAA